MKKNTIPPHLICEQCRQCKAIGSCGRIVCCASFILEPIASQTTQDPSDDPQDIGLCGYQKCCSLWENLPEQKVKPQPKQRPQEKGKRKVRVLVA